jgi:hypothetical protein
MPTTRARTVLFGGFDSVDIATLGGADTVDDQLPAGVIQLCVDGTPQPRRRSGM